MSFPDPADASGTEEERLEAFRRVRDGLRRRALEYLETSSDTGAKGEESSGTS